MPDDFELTPQDYAERRARVEGGTATPEDYYRLGQYSAVWSPDKLNAMTQKFGIVATATAEVIPGEPR
ncbi:MAG: hypothetical protein ABWY81_10995 [Jiangellaceae bacterium]